MVSLVNNAVFTAAAGGAAAFGVSAALTGYQTPAAAGATDGKTYRYRAESGDKTQWEIGTTVASSTATSFTRVVTASSAGGTTTVNFTNPPTVAITMMAADVLQFSDTMALTSGEKDIGRSNLGVPGDNILINSDFRINQRIYVSSAALASGSYGHDRWKAGAGGGDYSFTQLASSTQITIAASKTLIQVIEDKNVVGGSYVLSWAGTAQARYAVNSATPAGSYASSPILITGQTAGTVMSVEFNAGTLGTVKLESGTVATSFVMRPYGQELQSCYRYFYQSQGNIIIRGPVVANILLWNNFRSLMRASPTSTALSVTYSNANSLAFSNPSVEGVEFNFQATAAGGYVIFTYKAEAEL